MSSRLDGSPGWARRLQTREMRSTPYTPCKPLRSGKARRVIGQARSVRACSSARQPVNADPKGFRPLQNGFIQDQTADLKPKPAQAAGAITSRVATPTVGISSRSSCVGLIALTTTAPRLARAGTAEHHRSFDRFNRHDAALAHDDR